MGQEQRVPDRSDPFDAGHLDHLAAMVRARHAAAVAGSECKVCGRWVRLQPDDVRLPSGHISTCPVREVAGRDPRGGPHR